MNIVIPDDYQDAVRRLDCFAKLRGHDVTVFHDTVKDLATLEQRFRNADALVLIRERTAIGDELLSRLPRLELISQTGKGASHIDVESCTRRGVSVAVGTGSPYAPAELTWALVLAAMRRVSQEWAHLRLAAGSTSSARQCVDGRWASSATARSAVSWRATAVRSG